MTRFSLPLVTLLVALPAVAGSLAATSPPLSIHDPTGYALVWSEPGVERTIAREDLVFGRPAGRDLRLDLVAPAGLAPGELRPAVVFLSGLGDAGEKRPLRRWEIYRSWMRTLAARGYVAVMGESDREDVAGSLTALFEHLSAHGRELGIDTTRLGVYACSANVTAALPFLMSDAAAAPVRAAVIFYGAGEIATFRRDLPVLLAIAGRDTAALLERERQLAADAAAAGAPWTVVHAPELPHAFDLVDPSPESRAVIGQALAFWDGHLGRTAEPAPLDPERSAARQALADLYGQRFEAAHEYLNQIADGEARRDGQLWRNLAWARQAMGSSVGAMLALEQAVEAEPDDLDQRRGFAKLAGRLSGWTQVDDALSPVETSAELDAVDLGLLGLARLHLGRPEAAVAPLERAVAAGGEAGSHYNLACALARTDRVDEAFRALAGALAAGFTDAAALASDPDLANLRGDPRFAPLAARLDAAPPSE